MLESRPDNATCRSIPHQILSEADGPEAKHARYNVRSRYEFVRTLGKGTYGKVKLAVQKDTGKLFAVKTIRKDRITDKKDMQHIRREMKIMSSLHHPNIIQIHEVFENHDKIVIVMEYASKGELYDYLADKKITSEEESRVFFRQIVSAVQYCHKHGVVHRDLKLENILLGENFEIKIADFGLANLFKSDQQLSTFCGSPLYASPEIVNGVKYTGPEVDSWSLGVLLYALVYGMMPFDGSDYKTLTRQISNGEYSQQTKHPDAGDLIGKMLTVDPMERADIDQIADHYWLQSQHADILDANSNYVTPPKNIYSPPISVQQQQQQLSTFSPVPNGFMNHSTSPSPPILNGYIAPATSPNPAASGFVAQPNSSPNPHVGKLASEKLKRTVLTPCALENCEHSNCPLTQRKGILKRFGTPIGANPVQSNFSSLPPSWPQYASPVQHNTLSGAMFVKDASCGLQAKDSLKLKAKPPGASGKRRNLRSKKDRESGYYSSPERTPVEPNPSQPAAPVFTFAQPVIKPQLATNINPANLKPRHVQPPSDIILPNQFGVPFPYVMPMASVNQTMPILEGQAMSYFPTNQVTVANSVEQSPVVPYTVTTLNSQETHARGQRPISTYSDSSILSSDSFELCTFESLPPTAVIFSTVGLTPANTVIHSAQPTATVALSPAVRPPALSLPISSPLHYSDGRSSPVPSGALTPTSAKLNQDLTRILAPNEPRIRKNEDARLREPRTAKLTEEQETQLGEMMRQLSIDLERACPKGIDNMKVSLTASAEV